LQHIFDRFYQLDNSQTRKAEGTGIGLALTKELVKLMEGIISVKSPPAGANKGSEFTVTLPMVKIATPAKPNTPLLAKDTFNPYQATDTKSIQTFDEHQNQELPLILLAEDNADVAAYTASCLSGYRLTIARDGKEGFDIAGEIIPDIVITDVMMPNMDGFELCRRLKNGAHTSHIPIIMITAKADMESKIEGLQQGADAYLQKPFFKEELLVRITKLLELRHNLQQHYLRQLGLNSVASQDEPIQETRLVENKEEDVFVKRIRKLVEENISDANFTVEKLCKLVFISHSQLHRKLEATTGLSPNKFIRLLRLTKAKTLLMDPSNSIAAVADNCGFNDPGYFTRVFKQDCGLTPQDWRVRNRLTFNS
jgi:DNA-binding response OmpR family regulator